MAKHYGIIAKEIFSYLFMGAAIAITLTSPFAAASILRYFQNKGKYKKKEEQRKFMLALRKLKKNRLIILQEESGGKFLVKLTERGRHKKKEFLFQDLQIPIPSQWDGVWRIVIFDIPRSKNKGRNALREKLKSLGFTQLQESVWAFPYPCTQEIEFVVEFFGMHPYIHIIEGRIKNDSGLKKHFHLF